MLGHSAHPFLTDVPLGVWSSAALLDLLGGPGAAGAPVVWSALGWCPRRPLPSPGARDCRPRCETTPRGSRARRTQRRLAGPVRRIVGDAPAPPCTRRRAGTHGTDCGHAVG